MSYPLVQVKVRGRDSALGPYCNSESDLGCNCKWCIMESAALSLVVCWHQLQLGGGAGVC